MAKEEFHLARVTRERAADVLRWHYLGSKNFRSGYNYGLLKGNPLLSELVGICIFTNFPVPELVVGLFGLERTEQDGMFELSRLALRPDVQGKEYNLASWFVARAIKRLRSETVVRAILAYADSQYHEGIVYRALNFGYYGLSEPKSDFWFSGETKRRPRSRKHRYLMVFDESLNVKW